MHVRVLAVDEDLRPPHRLAGLGVEAEDVGVDAGVDDEPVVDGDVVHVSFVPRPRSAGHVAVGANTRRNHSMKASAAGLSWRK